MDHHTRVKPEGRVSWSRGSPHDGEARGWWVMILRDHHMKVKPECGESWSWGITTWGWSQSVVSRDHEGSPHEGEARGWWVMIMRDHHMRVKPEGGEPWSWGINPDSHPKRVNNSSSATKISPIKYLHNGAKHLFLSERLVLILSVCYLCCFVTWHKFDLIDQSASQMTFFLGLLPCHGCCPGTTSW